MRDALEWCLEVLGFLIVVAVGLTLAAAVYCVAVGNR